MQALILAAGKSERFWPLGDKNFFEIDGQTLFARQITNLRQAGVRKFIVVGNEQNSAELRNTNLKADYVLQKDLKTGQAGAVLAAAQLLTQPTLIVSTNDCYPVEPLRAVLQDQNSKFEGALLAQKITEYFPGGYLAIDEKNFLKKIVEKPAPSKVPSNLINLVCHFYQKPQDLILELKKLQKFQEGDYERALSRLSQTQKFKVVLNSGKWQPVKFPWHILDLVKQRLTNLKVKIAKSAQIAPTAQIQNSIIESGVKVLDFAIIQNSIVKESSLIGSHTLVRDSLINQQALVGSHSEVARSLIGRGITLHRNYIGDSVLAEGTNFGAGAITANLRFDQNEILVKVKGKKIPTKRNKLGSIIGPGCKIGVNTTISPGILIGKNTFCQSQNLIQKNLKENTFYSTEFKTNLRPNNFPNNN